jgi:hypothetical protein
MAISGNAGDGINGVQVVGLTLAASTLSGNGTPGDVGNNPVNEDGLNFAGGLTGTVSITDSTLTGSADSYAIITAGSGTLGLTVTGDTFSANNASTGWAGLELNTNGTTATINADDNDFQNIARNDVQITATGGTLTGTVNNNTVGTPTVSGNHIYQYDDESGLYFDAGVGNADLNLTATGNTIADPGPYAHAGIMGIDGARTGDSGTVWRRDLGQLDRGLGPAGPGRGRHLAPAVRPDDVRASRLHRRRHRRRRDRELPAGEQRRQRDADRQRAGGQRVHRRLILPDLKALLPGGRGRDRAVTVALKRGDQPAASTGGKSPT